MTGAGVALCGAGMIAGAHGLAARILGVPVVAVASRTPASAAKRAREFGGAAVTYDELPGGAELVVVSTPPAQHTADALRLLAAGVGVLLEKPLCRTLAEADALVAAAGAHGHRLAYGENLAYAPVLEAMVAETRRLGPLQHLSARAINPRPTWGDFLSDEWGGGALFDLGVHPLAVVLLLAAPARVVAVAATLEGGADHGTDEHAEVTLTFATGLTATVVASWRGGEIPQWDAQAASADGVVRADLLPTPVLEHNGDEVALPTVTAAVAQIEQYGYLGQLKDVLDAVRTGRRPRVDADFGRVVLDVVCAAYASARNDGRPEAVPFTGRRDRTPLELWRG